MKQRAPDVALRHFVVTRAGFPQLCELSRYGTTTDADAADTASKQIINT